VIGSRRGDGQRVPAAAGGEHAWIGKGQGDGAWTMGSCEGKTSIDAWDVEKGEA